MKHYRYERFVDAHMDVAQRMGDEWVVRCPFPEKHKHGDQNPSCSINVRSGAWICFSCGERGGISHLEKVYRSKAVSGVNQAALTSLREEISERRKPHVEAANIYPESWLNQFDNETGYWRSRGFDDTLIAEWRLGYDPEANAATIPLRTLDRAVIGVIRRHLDRDARPRYQFPKSFRLRKYVWGAWADRPGDVLAFTEGAVDALALWQVGVPAVSLLSANITEDQVRVVRSISPRTIITVFDNDKAGRHGTHRFHEMVPGVRHLVAWDYGRAKDAADLSLNKRRALVRSAEPYREWVANSSSTY